MDTGEADKFALEKRNDDPMNYQSSVSSDWRFGTPNFTSATMGLVPTVNPATLCKADLVCPSSCLSASIVSSFDQAPWDQGSNSPNLGYSGINVQHNANSSDTLGTRKTGPGTFGSGIERTLDMGWNPPSSMLKGGLFLPNGPGMLPQSLTQFPADSGFIERAARFSCFNSGNFSDMVNPFGTSESMGFYSRGGGLMQGPQDVFTGNGLKSVPCSHGHKSEPNAGDASRDISLPVEHGATETHPHRNEGDKRPRDEAKVGAGGSGNESEEAESSGDVGQDDRSLLGGARGEYSLRGFGSKKRKKTWQDTEIGQAKESPQPSGEATKDGNENQSKGDQNPASTSNKAGGRHSKRGPQGSDPAKEEYIHVRARRGQATNSHSLAERVRREKISERMKFLQDLVPGCSKVTGKAVMLDEIINYVQSLQRQVEFLSMKLATVNPRLDFNIGLLAKDILQPRAGPSSVPGFSPEMPMAYPLGHHSTQPGLVQAGLYAMGSSSDLFRRTTNPQMTHVTGGFKEPTQIPHVWEDELHNVIQMGFGTSALSSGQEENGNASPFSELKTPSSAGP